MLPKPMFASALVLVQFGAYLTQLITMGKWPAIPS
jgi:hypothetical protein